MNLKELTERAAKRASWPRWRLDNTRTAIKCLAQGLGKPDHTECSPADYLKPIDTLIDSLNKAMVDSSPDRVRQNRNYIRYLFKTALALELIKPLAPAPAVMSSREAIRKARSPFGRPQFDRYALESQDWPREIKTWWEEYKKEAAMRIKPVTLEKNEELLRGYLGFLKEKANTPQDLFNPRNAKDFLSWLAGRLNTDGLTRRGYSFLGVLISLTRQTGYEEAAKPLAQLKKELRRAVPLHDKEKELDGLSLRDIERVGRDLLEASHRPTTSTLRNAQRPGLTLSSKAQLSLILRLLVRIPFRQRCIREMRLDHNLLRRSDGRWTIRFRGEELKIAERGGKPNTFNLNFPSDLVPQLGEYLKVHRPRLLGGKNLDLVFVTIRGAPWTSDTLCQALCSAVYQRIEKHFYPHLIRTMWATEMAQNPDSDIHVVAYMMNDKIETVYKEYYAHSGRGLQEKADEMLKGILGAPGRGEEAPVASASA